MTTNQKPSMLARLVEVTSNIRAHELRATAVSFLMVFILMASYFVLRPVRDAMASDWSDTEVSFLWNLQFFISAGIISLYGWLISRVRFRNIVPMVYAIFSASFLMFYFAAPVLSTAFSSSELIDKSFYLWVSAFSLFHLSVFWSLMATTFTKEQSKRLFAVIASGSSAGAIVGPAIPAFFANHLGLDTLMLIAACGLALVVPLVLALYRLQRSDLQPSQLSETGGNGFQEPRIIGGDWWAGFLSVVRNRYLLSIGLFILLYVFIGSFVYFEQKNLLADYSRPERAQILGIIDWMVNVLTFVLALFVTSRIVTKLGMPITLMLLPLALIFGMLVLAIAPLIVVVMAVQIARRTGNYAVARPAREMLFTQVSEEERFKSKPVIDVVVYRGGDAVSGTLFAILSDGLGLGLAAIAVIGAAISGLWAKVALSLGRTYEAGGNESGGTLAESALARSTSAQTKTV